MAADKKDKDQPPRRTAFTGRPLSEPAARQNAENEEINRERKERAGQSPPQATQLPAEPNAPGGPGGGGGGPPEELGTSRGDAKSTPVRRPVNAGVANPQAPSAGSSFEARNSVDRRTRETHVAGTPNPKPEELPEEGQYRDPDSVGPNPDVEAYPNQKPNESRKFRFRPHTFGSNSHQVYPEAFLGTTNVDPDIREADDKPTAEQVAEMVKRRDPNQPETTPLDPETRFTRRKREFLEAAGTPQEDKSKELKDFKYSGGLEELQPNESYTIRSDQRGSFWWQRKYNNPEPTIKIVGEAKDVLGYDIGARVLMDHPLTREFRERRNAMPKNHPIRKDDKPIYVGTVDGRQVLVHPFEVEDLKDKGARATPAA